jgi:hypothetical protein
MKLRRMRVKSVVQFYLGLAFFPGCFCSHLLRMAFFAEGLGALLIGMLCTLVPYTLLALGLLSVSRVESSRRIESGFFTGVARVALLLIIPLAIVLIQTNSVILDFDRGVREYDESTDMGVFVWHWIATWLSGCLFGLAILLFGVVSIVRHSEESDSRPSEEPPIEDRHG